MIRSQWLAAACLLFTAVSPAAAQPADVIHFWTSGGESRAVAVFTWKFAGIIAAAGH